MASAFGHALSAVAFGSLLNKEIKSPKFWILGIVCAVLPDLDVLAFKFNIEYGHMFGHRGFTHSIFFAFFFSLIVVGLFYKRKALTRKKFTALWLYFFICVLSHALLDALTTGGKGVALLAPFTDERYFLPWRVIRVSPMSISRFFTDRAFAILASEAFWIGIPSIIIIIIGWGRNKIRSKNQLKAEN